MSVLDFLYIFICFILLKIQRQIFSLSMKIIIFNFILNKNIRNSELTSIVCLLLQPQRNSLLIFVHEAFKLKQMQSKLEAFIVGQLVVT